MRLGSKEADMNLKKLIAKEASKAAAGKLLPMDSDKKGLSKGKMTLGALVVAIAALVFEYLS